MELLDFKPSEDFTLGTELEFQIINPRSRNLIASAKQLLRSLRNTKLEKSAKPEITQSMFEINSSVHQHPGTLLTELIDMRNFLDEKAKKFNILLCGGGTHPFQKWVLRKIFPTPRFKEISHKFRYLAKRATVFGQHVHIGCSSAEAALYLTHILSRFVPQLIALSASSPFYQGIDTGFASCRSTIFNNTSPLGGTIPYLSDWQTFSNYFFKLKKLGIVKTMKDFYWDVRPKPEFGTVEIRVCDTPLTFQKAVLIAAYIQTLSAYILTERPLVVCPDLYTLYSYNRFQAVRYGYAGEIVDPYTSNRIRIQDDLVKTLELIRPVARSLGTENYIRELNNIVIEKSEADLLREVYEQTGNLKSVVDEQCRLWKI